MEEKASFGWKKALLCVVATAMLGTGGALAYLVWSEKRRIEAFEQAPITADELPDALSDIQYFGETFRVYEAAVMMEKVAGYFEEIGDMEQMVSYYIQAAKQFNDEELFQRGYELLLHCLSLPLDSDLLFFCEIACSEMTIGTLLCSSKALEHLEHCEVLAPLTSNPEAHLAWLKCEQLLLDLTRPSKGLILIGSASLFLLQSDGGLSGSREVGSGGCYYIPGSLRRFAFPIYDRIWIGVH